MIGRLYPGEFRTWSTLSLADLNKRRDCNNNSELTSTHQERGRQADTHRQAPLLLLGPPCLLLSAPPASRTPAVLHLSPVGNEFYHQPETEREAEQQQNVSRAEPCAGLGSVLTCPEWKLYEATVNTLNMLLCGGLRQRQIPLSLLKKQLFCDGESFKPVSI